MITEHCNQLIKKGLIYQPLYSGKLSNHLPMSLVALDKMGASETIQNVYFASGSKKLVLRASSSLKVNNINDALGKTEYFEAYFQYFNSRIEKETLDSVIKESLSVLIKGISAAAFHAFIRFSYALETNNKNEISYSLAYWCAEYNALKFDENQLKSLTIDGIINQVNSISQNHTFSPGIIIDRMNEMNAVINSKKVNISPTILTLNKIRNLCLDIFTSYNNFTMLHCITSCHAFRICATYFNNEEEALKYFWEAIIIAYSSTQLQYKPNNFDYKPIAINWVDILKIAKKSTNDHVIKLVYSCWEEDKFYSSDKYKYLAFRAIKKMI